MLHKRIVVAVSVFSLCLSSGWAGQNQGSTTSAQESVASASAALRKLLIAEQGDDALRACGTLINAIQATIKADPPASFESTGASLSAKPPVAVLHYAELIPLLTQLDTSVTEGKLIRARDLAIALVSAAGESYRAQKPTAAHVLSGLEEQAVGVSAFMRYLMLPKLAAAAYDAGDYARADAYSSEVLADNEKYWKTGGFGEATFYGNLIKGRLQMVEGNVAGASTYLLAAGLCGRNRWLVSDKVRYLKCCRRSEQTSPFLQGRLQTRALADRPGVRSCWKVPCMYCDRV